VQAIVLVGGLGTRLRPLTATIPKQLLPVAGVPMIERVLAQIAPHGVDRAVLSMGYLPDPFIAAYPDHVVAGIEVSFAIEPFPLGTAGAIRFAARAGEVDDTFLAVNGDVLTDLDVGALVATHRASGAEGTIHLTPVEDPSRYGVVGTDADGVVMSFVEKPAPGTAPSNLINAGTYVLEPAFLDRIDDEVAVSVEREIFPLLVAEHSLYASENGAYWIDAGTPVAYLQANIDVLDGRRQVTHPGVLEGTTMVLEGTTVAPSARLHRTVLGKGVTVGPDARLENVVALDGATIEARASLTDCVVGPSAVIGQGVVLSNFCLIGRDEVVPQGTRRTGRPVDG
jgi:mannose-1-phosphate guanylyltransferase